jgi:hypothetical protein
LLGIEALAQIKREPFVWPKKADNSPRVGERILAQVQVAEQGGTKQATT